jgi:hypothetical protein
LFKLEKGYTIIVFRFKRNLSWRVLQCNINFLITAQSLQFNFDFLRNTLFFSSSFDWKEQTETQMKTHNYQNKTLICDGPQLHQLKKNIDNSIWTNINLCPYFKYFKEAQKWSRVTPINWIPIPPFDISDLNLLIGSQSLLLISQISSVHTQSVSMPN